MTHHDDHYTKLVSKVTRGEGTRDQDTTKVVTRHPDPEKAVEHHEKAVTFQKKMAENARGVQPTPEETDGDNDGSATENLTTSEA
jgi:hypothetical protein